LEELLIKSDKHYTYDDYLKLDDDHDYEIIGGNLIMEPRPRLYHQEVVVTLTQLLGIHLQESHLGKLYVDVDVVFGDQVVSPDIVFVSKDRLCIAQEMNIQGAPDLVIEVLSPSTQKHDRKVKSQLYFDKGVKEYWLVDPVLFLVEILSSAEGGWKRVAVYDEGDRLSSPVLPGLQIEVKDIFGLT